MKSDHQKSKSCNNCIIVGIGLAVVFSVLIGNVGVGLVVGLSLSFLTGIIYQRLMLKA